MSEKKLSGFAALMRQRRKEREKEVIEKKADVKPVIKEASLTC